MTPALAETLAMIGEAAATARDPWWIIGSTAVLLHGGKIPHVNDVDLLMSAADADGLLHRVGEIPRTGHGNALFRSSVFGIWNAPPIPAEIFGGFSVATARGWHEVNLTSRQEMTVGLASVYVPTADELTWLLNLFGRDKDLERARLLPR